MCLLDRFQNRTAIWGRCSLRSETTRISRVVPRRNGSSHVRPNYCWLVDLSYLFISECPVNSNTIALSGAAKVLMASWEAVSDEVRRVFIEADCKHDTLNTIDLGAHRVYTVAEATLWASFGGVSFATQVASVVSREAPATGLGKKIISILFKEAKAVKFSQSTPMSVNKFFQSSVFSPRPRVLRKGTAAAVAEAAAAAAAAHAASELADLEKKASFYDRPGWRRETPPRAAATVVW